MLNAGKVIEEGKQAYRDGIAWHECPYEPPEDPTHIEGFHGAVSIGMVRVGLDYEQLWQTGWEIAQRYEPQHAHKHCVAPDPKDADECCS